MPSLATPYHPTNYELRTAVWMDLGLEPSSEASRALTAAVVSRIAEQHLAAHQQAKFGPGTRTTWERVVGIILGGLLSAEIVSVQLGHAAARWARGDMPCGYTAFNARIGGLRDAGLLDQVTGRWMATAGDYLDGVPTRLWATPALLELVAAHGLTRDSVKTDWRPRETAKAPKVLDLIGVRPFTVRQHGAHKERASRVVAAVPEHLMQQADEIRAGVQALNDRIQRVGVGGMPMPAFRRSFMHDFRFGGRFYSVGQGTFSNIYAGHRSKITIGGDRVVEVDISASQLTVCLALGGVEWDRADGDLYGFHGLHRDTVKEFCKVTMGSGKAPSKWPKDTKPHIKATRLADVRSAVLSRFPMLEDLRGILPADAKLSLPPEVHHVAAGQHIVFREAEVIAEALERLADEGIVALPLHDALVVPESASAVAQAMLESVFEKRLGVSPLVKEK